MKILKLTQWNWAKVRNKRNFLKKFLIPSTTLYMFLGLPFDFAASQQNSPFINNAVETKKTIDVQAARGDQLNYAIQTKKRHHYTICIAPQTGDADLYGRFMKANRIIDAQSSLNRGIWPGQNIPYRDCIVFEVNSAGTIEITISVLEDFQGSLYFVGTPYDNVPAGFEDALISPLTNPHPTSSKWGPFGSPWGNNLPEYNPFSDKDHDGFLHSGTDIEAAAGTPVKAACDGNIRRNGMLDDDTPSGWGGYTILECTSPLNGTIIALGYDHIQPQSALQEGTPVQQGDPIGLVYNMLVPGEEDHLHLTICHDTYDACAQSKQQPQRGSLYYEDFPGKWIESDPNKNIGLYKP